MEKHSFDENNNSPPTKRLKTDGVESSSSINSSVRHYADQVLESADNVLPGQEDNNSEEKEPICCYPWLKEPGGLRWHLLTGVEMLSILRPHKVPSPAFLTSQRPETYLLHTLFLGRVEITIADLAELLCRCPHLRELSLPIDPLNQCVCHVIGTKLPGLTTVTLKLYGNVGGGVKLILRGCRSLTTLYLKQCSTRDVPLDVVRDLPSSIRSFKALHWTLFSSDEDVELLVSRCPDIEDLAIDVGRHTFTEKTLLSLSRLQSLKTLQLSRSKNIPALALCHLKEISSLESLQLVGSVVPNEEMTQILSSLPGVTVNWPKHRSKAMSWFQRKQNNSEKVKILYHRETDVNFDIEKIKIKMEQLEENRSEGEESANLNIETFEVKMEKSD